MKLQTTGFSIKAISKTTVCAVALMFNVTGIANDGRQPVTNGIKGPVNYYQAFMICLLVSYGIYLIVRARRRKRNSKITE